jgi:hypothetical protein
MLTNRQVCPVSRKLRKSRVKTAVKRFKRVMIEFAFVNRCKIRFKLRKLFIKHTHNASEIIMDICGYNEYLTKLYPMILSNAANPDPGSGVFLTLDP